MLLMTTLAALTSLQAQPAPPPATAPAATTTTTSETPATDSRGIPVESAPAEAPAGTNIPVAPDPAATVVVNPNQQAAFAPTAAPVAEVPPCSKTVTDRCKQTYEKQGR